MYTVTIEEAVRAGKFKLVYQPVIMLIVANIWFLNCYADWEAGCFGGPPGLSDYLWTIFLAVTGSGLAGLIWRAFHSTKWKIWAYSNVQDIQQLQQRAESSGVLPARGGWLDRLEYKTADQRAKLRLLEKRFDTPSEPVQPVTTAPDEAIFKYNFVFMYWFSLFIGGIGALNGIFHGPFLGYAFVFLGIFLGIASTIFNASTVWDYPFALKLTAEGINKQGIQFMPWAAVERIEQEVRLANRSSSTYLVFKSKTGDLEIELDYIRGSDYFIRKTAHRYWEKSKQK